MVCLVGLSLGLRWLPSYSSSYLDTSKSSSFSSMIGAEPILQLKTADFWLLTLGMQVSSSSSSSEELVQIFFGLDIQIILFQHHQINIPNLPPPKNLFLRGNLLFDGIIWREGYYIQRQMFKKEERTADRYDSQRNFKLANYVSRQLTDKSSKYRNARLHSGSKKSVNNLNSSEIYSQPQLVRPKRGVSVAKNASKSKYAESMNKFRKEFIKNSNANYEYANQSYRKPAAKEDPAVPTKNLIGVDGQIGVQDLHYQMVKLHQNVKKMHHQV